MLGLCLRRGGLALLALSIPMGARCASQETQYIPVGPHVILLALLSCMWDESEWGGLGNRRFAARWSSRAPLVWARAHSSRCSLRWVSDLQPACFAHTEGRTTKKEKRCHEIIGSGDAHPWRTLCTLSLSASSLLISLIVSSLDLSLVTSRNDEAAAFCLLALSL